MMYTIDEQSDVFADAAASDDNTQLLFMSVFGRDTSVQQLLARCHLPCSQGGIDKLTFRRERQQPGTKAETLALLIGDPGRLDKLTGRLPKGNLFGNLVHAWIFDPAILEADRGGRTGWNLRQTTDARVQQSDDATAAIWSLVKDVSPLPLLDHWQRWLLQWLEERGAIRKVPTVGRILATRVVLPDTFERDVSTFVKQGALMLTAVPTEAAALVD